MNTFELARTGTISGDGAAYKRVVSDKLCPKYVEANGLPDWLQVAAASFRNS